MTTKSEKIRTPRGRLVTVRQYIALTQNLRDGGHPCEYGHFGCALWVDGPCSDELLSGLEAAGEEI